MFFYCLVIATLRGGGNVLIPVDSGSRVLEVCLAFDRYWASSKKRGAYNLALLNPLHSSMLDIAQTNLNYMSTDINDKFTKDRINPFQFRYVHQCSTQEELRETMKNRPHVVFATTNTLEYGCGHGLLEQYFKNSKNIIIFTERCPNNTLGCRLANSARRLQEQLEKEQEQEASSSTKKGKGKGKGKKVAKKTTKKAIKKAIATNKKRKRKGSTDSIDDDDEKEDEKEDEDMDIEIGVPSKVTFTRRKLINLDVDELERWAAAREIEMERKAQELQQQQEKEEALHFKMNQDMINNSINDTTSLTTSIDSNLDSKSKEQGISITKYSFTPAYAMFGYTKRTAHFDDYGEQTALTPYMDQFALRDATSIELLVEGDDVESTGKEGGKKKKTWRERMNDNKEEEDEDNEEDGEEGEEEDDDEIPQKIVTEEIELDIKCR